MDDTYYLAVSSFLTHPGIPIYKSKDLANWELVSHALADPYNMPLHGIRQNNGMYALLSHDHTLPLRETSPKLTLPL